MQKNIIISSVGNPLVKEAAGLRQKKYREERRAFLLEGEKCLWEALAAGFAVQRIFFAPAALPPSTAARLAAAATERAIPLTAVTGEVISKLADSVSPQPIVAVLDKFTCALAELRLAADSFVLILDELKDPGNLGTIIRTAAAAGIDAVIMTKGCVDLFSPKTLRAAMGALFHLPVLEGCAPEEILDWLRGNHFTVLAAAARAESNIYQTDFSGRVAVVLGGEAQGVGEFFLRAADRRVGIPMKGRAESLNVAVAAALFIYQARGRW